MLYIHIGRGIVIRSVDIIALLDKKTVEYQREKHPSFFYDMNPLDLDDEQYRTLVITDQNKYFSPFTTKYFTSQLKREAKSRKS